ncbi:MAG TPA: ABC transporter substrate-binding protein [Ilumatobacteraceae bacterium]|nr:ABC transporter substrate-binding protein [Ilumatobacteraceae bacterium]
MRTSRMRWLTLALPLGLLAASCGGDDDDGDTADTVVTDDDTTAPAPTTGGTDDTTAPADTTGGADTTTAPSSDFEGLAYDESALCGTDGYTGNLAKLEAVDELTVKFTMCAPDVALPSKVAFSSLQIQPQEYIDSTGGTGEFIEAPIGTGPYKLEAWERGSQIVLTANEDYWGTAPMASTAVFRWSEEAAQRLVELQSGAVDGIDNVGASDFATVQNDSNLQLIERDPLNVFYLGFNVDKEPFTNEALRQAIGYAIDKERLVSNFYPAGSLPATQFLPPGIPQYDDGAETFTADQEQARALLTEAGYPDGLDITLSYRNVVRGYLPEPAVVAVDIQSQLAEVGINVTLEEQESGTFIDNANSGNLSFYMLGWGADFPDATNFWDFHFGVGASPQFGTGFPEMHAILTEAGSTVDEAARNDLYAQANELLFQHAQAIPIAYGGSGLAYKASVEGAHASPLSNESLAAMGVPDQDQFTFLQNGEPSGLYCADETDGEALRVCEQIGESLLAYEVGGTEAVESLATEWESNEDLTEWTFTLRPGVTFHDGSTFDANDVVQSYRVQWDAADPAHVGREGTFTYWGALFGGFLNPPPAED